MRKKTHLTRRKLPKRRRITQNNIVRLTIHYLVGLLMVAVLVTLLYPLFVRKPAVPCANSKSCKESFNLKVENNAVGVFNNRLVNPPAIALLPEDNKQDVLGTTSSSAEKHIYIDLAKQTLYAYEGDILFMQTLISSGKWNRTPTGDFTIWVKLRSTRMSGGQGDDYYDLPNVPYVMFFSNKDVPQSTGFSFHGAYWHNNFGHPMSHGCINMRFTDVEKLYNWANPVTNGTVTHADQNNQGTKVTIYGDAP